MLIVQFVWFCVQPFTLGLLFNCVLTIPNKRICYVMLCSPNIAPNPKIVQNCVRAYCLALLSDAAC